MAIKLQKFNRIINFFMYSAKDIVVVRCPERGRKPNITINGSFTTENYLPAFNITVKNMYLELKGKQFNKILVKAGYENNIVTLEGTIISLYQETPGPEGSTVIQCVQGSMQEWMDSTISMNYGAGTMLSTIMTNMSLKLKTYGARLGQTAMTLMLNEPFEYDGTVRGAIDKLRQVFNDQNLCIVIRNNVLTAVCLSKGDSIQRHKLEYLSAPPQSNAGDSSGTYYTTVTAPWEPKLQIGDALEIPTNTYIKNFSIVNSLKKTQTIQVTAISFSFSTVGSENQMIVQGFNTKL